MNQEFLNNFNELRAVFGNFFIGYELWIKGFIEDKPFEELRKFYYELEEREQKIDEMIRPFREYQGIQENYSKQREVKSIINSIQFPAQASMYSLQNLFSCLLIKNQ